MRSSRRENKWLPCAEPSGHRWWSSL